MPGWTIVGLRPPMGFGFSMRDDRGGFDGDALRFVPCPATEGVRLELLVPVPIDGIPAEQREQLAWQIVNIGLGERLAARIEALELGEGRGDEGRPIAELAAWVAATPASDRDRHGQG